MPVDDEIRRIAEERHALHEGQASSRPLSPGYEDVGLRGEFRFGQFCGQMPDLSERPKGDGGIDFVVPLLFTVDVKTARNAFNLIHEKGKPFCDIYVLIEYDDATKATRFLGWTWGRVLAKAPTRDFGYGIESHYIAREKLRPMSELDARIFLRLEKQRAPRGAPWG